MPICPRCSASASSPGATAWSRWARSSPSCWAMWPAACWRPCPAWGLPGWGRGWVLVGLVGRGVAQFVPPVPATDPGLRINWNPFTETWRNLQLAQQNVVVFRSLLGISWMWFFGAMFLSQFPSLAKEVLHGDEQVASLLLVVFSVGIGIGALLCERLSRRHLEIGLVPLGAIGMSWFA